MWAALLRPAAAGVRSLLACVLLLHTAIAVSAFLLLPRRLAALINRLAASSPLCSRYYSRHGATSAGDDDGDGSNEASGGGAGEGGSAQAEVPAMRLLRRNPWRVSSDVADGAEAEADPVGQPGQAPQGQQREMSLQECMRRYGSVPRMRVVIMVAGTRGDVQPAVALGLALQRAGGHCVRLATHEPYRGLVTGAGLEFFPLAGDPRGMMALTVKHKGMLFGDLRDLAWLRGQYRDIMDSCWEAATSAPSPEGSNTSSASTTVGGGLGVPYKPDLVVATAITYGAVHVAEALGVPLHVISTIPWRPTQDICHPWARGFGDTLAGHCTAMAAAALPQPPPAWVKQYAIARAYAQFAAASVGSVHSAASWWSSALLDHMAHLGIADLVIRFRQRLGLPLLSLRNTGFALYTVPTTFTFSKSLVVRPRDWGPHVEVSGPLLLPAAAAGGSGASDYTPPPDLVEFLARDPGRRHTLYIGFGSMTLAEELQLGQAIKTALAERPGVRAVVSAGGWGCLGLSGKVAEGQQAPDTAAAAAQSRQQGRGAEEAAAAPAGPLPAHHHAKQEETEQVRSCVVQQQPVQQVFVVGDVPHDWLFPRVAAVIHHGGVGTTAAGLLAGCPTFVAPSFGDLYFWGELCARAGVGPAPVPIDKLTADDIGRAIDVLLSSEAARQAAKRAGALLRQDCGVSAAVAHIYRGLSAAVST
ncbi:hypothetical protein CHLRE_07g333450v5 [Chlamydomonas reinhardtii]|uniref:Glycosyltransferase family 28 N-terminal domain-containing protein n=1 Tax=Chlamydomonas reinhardtii TaxID=3055 RepID=A8JIV0_CHLRE|nr:uncharacterized protein CHLRE_07g333450v5 [Chlamydomonas reinhardtii]PNW80878.1 hypothetical protein CHLRE_07g333450v5 [Chlamydomonas reinhardtii]|eukprot:XP_001691133.1 predicted protein [Chlamydomonas reinhardtii]